MEELVRYLRQVRDRRIKAKTEKEFGYWWTSRRNLRGKGEKEEKGS